jgi:hypothetical protein
MPRGVYKHYPHQLFKKGHKHSKEVLKKISISKTGQKHTEATKNKIRNTVIRLGLTPPSNYGRFKKVKGKITLRSSAYIAIHQWVVRKKGNPTKCEHCGTTEAKRFTWSNIDHKYKRNLNDYQELCYSCHKKYDLNGFKF